MLDYKDIAKIFEEIELRLVASLKRNLSRHKTEEQKEGFEWSAWQAEKLRNIDRFRRENLNIVNEYVDVIDSGTRRLMAEQFREGEQIAESEVNESEPAMESAPVQPPEPPTSISDEHFFGVNTPKMEKLMEDITTLEKTVETAAVRNMDDVYRTTLNKVQIAMGNGSMTLTEAVDLATREFLDKGINCIVYADNRRVNIADYVRMALRTTSTRAQLQGKAKRFAELGYDTVLISQYGGCSETCEPWQGKVYIDDVFTIWNGEINGDFGKSNYCGKWFMLLSVAIRGGLFHPNCRHTISQYIDGRTKIPEPIPVEKIKQQRELEQKQRAMERRIRTLKRKVEGTQDEKKAREYKSKLREAQKELKEFVNEHKDVLHRDYSREKIYTGEDKPKQPAPKKEATVNTKETDNENFVQSDKQINVSESGDEDKRKNIVKPVPAKFVQSDENSTNIPAAVMTDKTTGTTEPAEVVQETVKQTVETIEQPVETVTDNEENIQDFIDDTVDNSDESDIIEEDSADYFINDNNAEPSKLEYSFESNVTDEVREAFNEEYQKAVEMYGEIDTVSGVNVLTVVSKDEGLYNDNSQWLSLRHAEKKNGLKIMASVAQEKYKSGKWSTGHPRHAMRHEIGHAIQLHHRLYDTKWKEKYSKIVEIFDMAMENQNGYAIPSSYIDGDIAEFISECVAASYLNPKKQSKTIKAIFRIITGGV